ncbi:MAG: hypothetical protein KIT72_15415 [Polyangiaceae bacterium]|nr:hypothetical protein [Polyangiaceae bacterium]MCW5791804.1 hypothetical protein [Polyangiaceae bacterium]
MATPEDVYAPPENPPTPPAPGGRERHLSLVVILLLVFSGLGVLGGFSTLFSAAVNTAALTPPQQGVTPEFAAAQQQMMDDLRDVSMPVVAALIALITIGLEGFTAYSAWLAHRGLERGRALLAGTAIPLVMTLTAFKALWAVLTSIRSYGALQRFAEQITSAMPTTGNPGNIFSTTMLVGLIVGAAIAVAWAGVLLGFYVWGRRVLQSEEVIAKFAQPS